jgi:glycosyltransferase involved in cell wall biosynthesis
MHPSGATPELAVIILAVNAPSDLHGALASLASQGLSLEIVVVNSGGGDIEPIRAAADPAVRFVEFPKLLSPGAARNVGVRETRAPIVAFMASDHILTQGWCAARLARHSAGAPAVACAVINSHPRNLVAWAQHLAILVRRLPGIPPKQALRYGVSYERSLLERVGAFREDLRIGEDTELNGRLRGKDRPVWAPEVQTMHRNTTRLSAMLQDQYQRGRRSGFHWPIDDPKSAFLARVLRRFSDAVKLSFVSTRGVERIYVVASWPLLFLGLISHSRGFRDGVRAPHPAIGTDSFHDDIATRDSAKAQSKLQ